MIITRKCPFTGKINKREIDVNRAQLKNWQDGELAQNAFSNLDADDREFIMTGILPKLFPSE